jgi:hypothetical protein
VSVQADPITPATESVSLVAFGINRPPTLVRFYLDQLFLGDDATGPDYAILVPRSRLPSVIDPFARWRVQVIGTQGAVVGQGSAPVDLRPEAPPLNADIRFANMTDGQVVGGVLLIRVEVAPTPERLRLFLDQNLISESRTFPALFALNTSAYPNGDHLITAVAAYAQNQSASKSLRVSFSNTLSTPESWIRLTSPEPNGPLSGTILLHAEASPNTVRVRFFVDGALVWEDFEPEFNYVLDTRGYVDGNHLIEARADFSSGGHSGVAVVVTFRNQTEPPPPPPPPPIRIDSPADNATVNGPFAILVSTPNPAVIIEEVEFFLDGKQIGKKIFPPFQITADPSALRLTPGWHTLLISAEVNVPDGMGGMLALQSEKKFYASVRVNYQPPAPLPSL